MDLYYIYYLFHLIYAIIALKFENLQGETEVLEKYCSPEIIERCKAEQRICESQGTFYDNKVRKYSNNLFLFYFVKS